jgi:arginine-glutamic acid dipeptide repeat-containing protein
MSISDANLLTYLQAARSIAAFAGMCNRGSTEDMYDAAQSDSTTIYAIDILHQMQYDTGKALQYLAKNPAPAKHLEKKWSDEDQVRCARKNTGSGIL